MRRHSFDPISAALGLIAVLIGVLVTFDRIKRLDHDAAKWVAVAALLFGLSLIPWGRRTRDVVTTVSTSPDAAAGLPDAGVATFAGTSVAADDDGPAPDAP